MTQCCIDCVDNLGNLVTILRKTFLHGFFFFGGGGCSITAGQPEIFPTSKTIQCIFQDFNATMYYHQIKKNVCYNYSFSKYIYEKAYHRYFSHNMQSLSQIRDNFVQCRLHDHDLIW